MSFPFLSAAALIVILSPVRAQTVLNFVSVTPCRVIDTRETTRGALGAPALATNAAREFAVLQSACGVPANASAYAFNVTAAPYGPLPYLTVWPAGQALPGVSTLNSYQGTVVANAAIIPAGANGSISVYAAGATELIVDITGYFVPPSTTALDQVNQQIAQINQQITQLNQQVTPLAQQLSQVSQQAAQMNQQVGQFNQQLAQVNSVLLDLHSGGAQQGVALGAGTVLSGSQNTAAGYQALLANRSGNGNTALGAGALLANTAGNQNVGLGAGALATTLTGNSNIALGYGAGSGVGETSNSIEIGHVGQPGDNGVIRIGTPNTHQSTFIAGIAGAGVDVGNMVLVDENGQLGTVQSSARYKEDVQGIGSASAALMRLRPVQFHYKRPGVSGSKPVHYGLIAEEVAGVFPELVVHNRQGEIEAVQYHQLPALLLNELQKQQRLLAQQQAEIRREHEEQQALLARLAALESRSNTNRKTGPTLPRRGDAGAARP